MSRVLTAVGVAAMAAAFGLLLSAGAAADPTTCPPNCDRIPASAWIDPTASFDPIAAQRASVDLERLIVVRARGAHLALATAAALRSEGFRLVVVDVGDAAFGGTKIDDLAPALEERREQRDLAQQMLYVAVTLRGVAGDESVAAAVEARAEAEGHVHVERQRPRARLQVAACRVFAQIGGAEGAGELRG